MRIMPTIIRHVANYPHRFVNFGKVRKRRSRFSQRDHDFSSQIKPRIATARGLQIMNLSIPTSSQESAQPQLISSHTILLLCGVLFGMCVSNNISHDEKKLFVFAGTTGVIAFLGLSVAKRVQTQSQEHVAMLQVEERLDRHAHCDQRSAERAANTPEMSSTPVAGISH